MPEDDGGWLQIRKEQALALGRPVPSGFVVRQGSTAMREGSPGVKRDRSERDRLVEQGILIPDENPALFRFGVDHLFSSASRAAGVVIDGNSNGSHWRTAADGPSIRVEARGVFTRSEIEGAMDAFDRYSETGENAEFFDRFGTPQEFWVRSSRARRNRVYPTKPLVGFLLKKTEFNGGWGQKADAAARLHNSGFIIVDRDDRPASPPERYDHLIGDADRIRLCALNYYIEPGRESGASEVAIRASDLAEAMGLHGAFPNICQALGGEKFQRLANVPAPTCTEPNPSSSTTFTYKLGSKAEPDTVTEATSIKTPPATNLILYGPPGTGKTYATAWEAVRLCLGDADAERFNGNENRDALMEEYRRLVKEKRIEFVTFHQSMSYEEFVEGLKPPTKAQKETDAPQEDDASHGFRLDPTAGVFKLISDRAKSDRGGSNAGGLDRTRRIYRLGLTGVDWREDLQRAVANKEIVWGFGGDTDWSAPEYEDWEAIKQNRKAEDPSVRGNHSTVYGTWLVRFGAPDGSYVVLTVGRNQVVAFGRFAGDYRFEPATEGRPATHARPVEWIWTNPEGIDRAAFCSTPFTSFHPIYPLEPGSIDWLALENAVLGSEARVVNPRPFVLIIDEINRANISKVFGELITLLEQDKRIGAQNAVHVRLPYSKDLFGVPSNLHIIGTMNTADRSIALLDTALRRRFTFKELMPDPNVLSENVGGINLRTLLSTINDRIEYLFDREHQIGHAYFTGCRSRSDVEAVMRHKVIPLLAEYFYEDWSKVAAVLGDGPAVTKKHFLESISLPPPKGMSEDEVNGDKRRWRVKAEFDFSEFEA